MIRNYPDVISRIRKEFKIYLLEKNIKAVILGVSGGMDSALVAALARPVCDEIGIKLIGRSLPIETNKLDELSRADEIGKWFCHDYSVHDLSFQYNSLKTLDSLDQNVVDSSEQKFHRIKFGNMKARTRMVYLYNLAYKNRGMVLSTDNYTEFLLGFWTLHGDVGDYGMIQELWKTEVYNMAEWMCANELADNSMRALYSCIVCTATDGLGVSSSDLEQLLPDFVGTSRDGYKKVDEILINSVGKDIEKLDTSNPVVSRMIRTGFKRENPFNLKREIIVQLGNDTNWTELNI